MSDARDGVCKRWPSGRTPHRSETIRGMVNKKRQRKPRNRQVGGRVTASRRTTTPSPPSVRAQIPRPSVTEFTRIISVPVFATGEAGPPSGSQGDYQVMLVLGVPGVSSVATEMDFEAVLRSGDSLLQGTGRKVQLSASPTDPPSEFLISANRHRRLDRVEVTVSAKSFAEAEQTAHDLVMPLLSQMAVDADAAVEVKATVIIETATQNRQMGAVLIGSVKPAPEFAQVLTPELRPLVAAYREGLNCNSPAYQALAFYKIVEGVESFSKRERRKAQQQGKPVPADPLAALMPDTRADVPDGPPWSKERFDKYLGRTFQDVKDSFTDVIRNAVAHLTPGTDLRVPDFMDDVEQCREAVPILRYMARELIRAEIARGPQWGGPPSAGNP